MKINTYRQSKVDTKKLDLGETKCFKIHVENNDASCPDLKIHNKQMIIGDIIKSYTKTDENIKMRHDRGLKS